MSVKNDYAKKKHSNLEVILLIISLFKIEIDNNIQCKVSLSKYSIEVLFHPNIKINTILRIKRVPYKLPTCFK